MKLTFLSCAYTQVSDLSPLKNMKLTALRCDQTKVSDLSPLKNMKLTSLDLYVTPVSDLSPLKDTESDDAEVRKHEGVGPISAEKYEADILELLRYAGVRSIAIKRDAPLKDLWGDFTPYRDAVIFRSIKTLQEDQR